MYTPSALLAPAATTPLLSKLFVLELELVLAFGGDLRCRLWRGVLMALLLTLVLLVLLATEMPSPSEPPGDDSDAAPPPKELNGSGSLYIYILRK